MAIPSDAGGIWHFCEDFSAGVCFVARACDAISAPDLHHKFSEGLLVEADTDHKDLALKAYELAGEGKRATPLSCACFGDESFDAELLVVPGLRDGGIWLVAARGAGAFIFVVDVSRGFEESFEVNSPSQRCRAPPVEDIEDFLGDINPAFSADFLLDEVHREDGGQHFGADGFAVRAERRQQRGGQVGGEVVPFAGYVFFFQLNFDFHFFLSKSNCGYV